MRKLDQKIESPQLVDELGIPDSEVAKLNSALGQLDPVSRSVIEAKYLMQTPLKDEAVAQVVNISQGQNLEPADIINIENEALRALYSRSSKKKLAV